MDISFRPDVLEQSLEIAPPEIVNTDQGAPFTCADFTGRLESAGVRISMDGRGRALDNVFAERLRRTLKQEEVYLHDYQTPREAMQELAGFLLRYMSSVSIGHSVIRHQRQCRSAKERHTSLYVNLSSFLS